MKHIFLVSLLCVSMFSMAQDSVEGEGEYTNIQGMLVPHDLVLAEVRREFHVHVDLLSIAPALFEGRTQMINGLKWRALRVSFLITDYTTEAEEFAAYSCRLSVDSPDGIYADTIRSTISREECRVVTIGSKLNKPDNPNFLYLNKKDIIGNTFHNQDR